MTYPVQRPRRLRANSAWRQMVRETELQPSDFVYPLFAIAGKGRSVPVESMPGVMQHTVDRVVVEARHAFSIGVPAVLLFGVPEEKDAVGHGAYDPSGLVPTAIRAIKAEIPELLVWADVCLCEYTDHGHCGIITDDGKVDNDASLELLAKAAVTYAEAGADAVAPSDMMDGRVGVIRLTLDTAGFNETPIVSYAAKYSSAFYGPFRDAAHSTPAFGDRRSYQMDSANSREAIKEVVLDIEEGADIVMVKPAGAYLDVISAVRAVVNVPVAAYQVSGEYSMIKAAAERGWLDEKAIALESLLGIKRAGANIIITYFAVDAARWLKEKSDDSGS